MTSKLTTYCGAITIAATTVAQFDFSPKVTKVALCVASIATGVGLYFARDNKVTDEDAGAKPVLTPAPTGGNVVTDKPKI
jgi:hypothetical protein